MVTGKNETSIQFSGCDVFRLAPNPLRAFPIVIDADSVHKVRWPPNDGPDLLLEAFNRSAESAEMRRATRLPGETCAVPFLRL